MPVDTGYLLESLGMSDSDWDGAAVEYVQVNQRTGQKPSKCINARYRDNFLNGGSVKNKAIHALVPNCPRTWKGPMLFLGMEDIDEEPGVPSCDLVVSDLRDIVDWLGSESAGAESSIELWAVVADMLLQTVVGREEWRYHNEHRSLCWSLSIQHTPPPLNSLITQNSLHGRLTPMTKRS